MSYDSIALDLIFMSTCNRAMIGGKAWKLQWQSRVKNAGGLKARSD